MKHRDHVDEINSGYKISREKEPVNWKVIFLVFITCFLLALLVTSCGSSKKTTTNDTTQQRSSFDSAAWMAEKEKELRVKYEEEARKTIDEYNKAAEMGISFDTPEPFDSSKCPPCPVNTIEVKPDGTVKASGNLKGYKNKTTEQRIIIDSSFKLSRDSALHENEKLKAENIRISNELVKEKSKVVIKRWPWWIWFCAGAVSMLLLIIGLIIYNKRRTVVAEAGSEAERVYNKIKEDKLRNLK